MAPVEEVILSDGSVPPVTTPEGVPAETTKEEPKYVTHEELQQVAAETLRRAKQADADRTKAINEELTSMRARIKATGGDLSPEQETKLRTVLEDEYDSIPSKAQSTSVVPGPVPADTHPAVVRAVNFMKTRGVFVSNEDPEFAPIKLILDASELDEVALFAALGTAMEKKAARTRSDTDNAAARSLGTGGAGSSGSADQPTRSLWQNAHKQR